MAEIFSHLEYNIRIHLIFTWLKSEIKQNLKNTLIYLAISTV